MVVVVVFYPHHRRAAPMQAGLAVVGTAAALISASSAVRDKLLWASSGAMLGAAVPFTLLAMMKTNKQIIKQVGGL
jgi:hypothetical protein